jgi:hypothetical protein
MRHKSTDGITTISFRNKAEKSAAIRKAKVRHASLSHCARELFANYQPKK